MDITAESIAQAYATAPHGYVRVRHSIIAGEPWSSFVSTVVAVDGDTVAYTSDGIWYSRATRDESLAWELIDTPPACEHWECALIGPACAVGTDRAADLPACHVAGCDATPTHTDPAWSAWPTRVIEWMTGRVVNEQPARSDPTD